MKAKIMAFSGVSNSGKTTLIQKLITIFFQKQKILVIKHDPKDKAVFDTKGKDSQKFFSAGADVILSSPSKNVIFSHESQDLKKILGQIQNRYEYIFIEGYKDFFCPRICVAHQRCGEIPEQEIKLAQAIATDDEKLKNMQVDKILDLNHIVSIGKWIEERALCLDEIFKLKKKE